MRLHVAMCVPRSVATAGVADLNKPNPSFGQPACQQKLPAKIIGFFDADAVEIEHALGFVGDINRLGRGQLHVGRQFVSLGTGSDVRIQRIVVSEFLV